MDRNEAIKRIRAGLKTRSGKAWSVTGGRGTAWGWLTIEAPPARRTSHHVKKAGAMMDRPEDYEEVDTGQPGGMTTKAERVELGTLLGLGGPVHCQGLSVPASSAHWQEYIDRAEGWTPSVRGTQYWD